MPVPHNEAKLENDWNSTRILPGQGGLEYYIIEIINHYCPVKISKISLM